MHVCRCIAPTEGQDAEERLDGGRGGGHAHRGDVRESIRVQEAEAVQMVYEVSREPPSLPVLPTYLPTPPRGGMLSLCSAWTVFHGMEGRERQEHQRKMKAASHHYTSSMLHKVFSKWHISFLCTHMHTHTHTCIYMYMYYTHTHTHTYNTVYTHKCTRVACCHLCKEVTITCIIMHFQLLVGRGQLI